MKKIVIACCAFALLFSFSCRKKSKEFLHEIVINADSSGVKISPLLYGIFFEELDFAGDGGLYAELVRNTSFEKTEKTNHWQLITEHANANMSLDSSALQINKIQKRSLLLTISDLQQNGRVSAVNEGYWGINVDKDTTYTLSFFARVSTDFNGEITASLEDSTCKNKYAEQKISGLTSEWKKFSVKLVSTGTNHKARLVLSGNAKGKIWFDVISLFPPTYKNRPNGYRKDLINKLIALKPAFMRFPGGCYVQGYSNIEQAFDWKKSIGPLEEREGMYIMWSYYATLGMGYHEMLQLSEDIGSEPVYVANCGQTMRESVPDNKVQFWLQNALDAIEYANGSITTTWGAKRAAAGHPEPFNLKIIGIGNEDAVPQFQEAYKKHYELFAKVIKEKYPQMQFIQSVNHLTDEPKWNGQPADYVDHHYYRSPAWFFSHDQKFNKYPRNEPKVFISELASLSDDIGDGNLWGAIGEAAFMTSLERNADVIGMSCYAPLFRNINWRNWNPNMILFNNHQSFGIPSYYLWQLFMHNTGNVYIPSNVTNNLDTVYSSCKGKIGVGTWRTKAEFDDIKVVWGSDSIVEDFSKDAQRWNPVKGEWKVQDGAYQQLKIQDNCSSLFEEVKSESYTIALRARKISGDEGFLILFGSKGSEKFTWNIGGWNNSRSSLMCNNQLLSGEIGTPVAQKIESNRWYSIKISVENNSKIRCWLDGKLQQDYTVVPATMKKLFVSVNKVTSSNEMIVKVVNSSDKKLSTQLIINSIKSISNKATVITLTSDKKTDENSFAQPEKVIPQTKEINNFSKEFQYEFLPYSVTIMRAKAE